MADIEDAVAARGQAVAGLTALISTRFRPRLRQEDALPACVFERISTVPHHTGGSGSALTVARFRIWSVAETYLGAVRLSEQVKAAFSRWGGSSGGITVQQSFLDNAFDGPFDEQTRGFWRAMDFRIWYLAS